MAVRGERNQTLFPGARRGICDESERQASVSAVGIYGGCHGILPGGSGCYGRAAGNPICHGGAAEGQDIRAGGHDIAVFGDTAADIAAVSGKTPHGKGGEKVGNR